VILVDTRGTGLSEPRLGCPELDRAQVAAFIAPPLVGSQALPIYRRALTACWDRLVGEGVDPAAYTSAESAADLEALRRALGVTDWNLLAISADGVVGATYVRLFPDHVRSVVFDSTMAPQAEWGPDFDRGYDRLLEKVFEGCRANAACRATYPHVRRRFYRQIARLQAHPATLHIRGFRPHPITFELDGAGVYTDAVFEIGAGRTGYPRGVLAPLDYIWRISHGGLKKIYRGWLGTGPVANEHADDFLAQGKTMSYACHDLVGFVGRRDLRQAARDLPPLAPRYLGPRYDLADGYANPVSPAGCRSWHVGRAPRWQHRPLTGDVPTLVLGGEFDMGMPPYVVRKTARRMDHASYVELPASGHLQLASFTNGHDCARRIAAAFLSDPGSTLDTSCVAEVPAADFTPGQSSSGASPKSTVTVSKPLWRWAAAYPR
jgi:pimeloyl-ACP methyl ester carboxylesterase